MRNRKGIAASSVHVLEKDCGFSAANKLFLLSMFTNYPFMVSPIRIKVRPVLIKTQRPLLSRTPSLDLTALEQTWDEKGEDRRTTNGETHDPGDEEMMTGNKDRR